MGWKKALLKSLGSSKHQATPLRKAAAVQLAPAETPSGRVTYAFLVRHRSSAARDAAQTALRRAKQHQTPDALTRLCATSTHPLVAFARLHERPDGENASLTGATLSSRFAAHLDNVVTRHAEMRSAMHAFEYLLLTRADALILERTRLRKEAPELSYVLECCCFALQSQSDVARALGRSQATVSRRLDAAMARIQEYVTAAEEAQQMSQSDDSLAAAA